MHLRHAFAILAHDSGRKVRVAVHEVSNGRAVTFVSDAHSRSGRGEFGTLPKVSHRADRELTMMRPPSCVRTRPLARGSRIVETRKHTIRRIVPNLARSVAC